MTARHPLAFAAWPFWLLVAAWVCANVPSVMVTGSIRWAEGAKHFSHTDQLRQSVAALITGQSAQLTAPPSQREPLPEAPLIERAPQKVHFALVSAPLTVVGAVAPPARPVSAFRPPVAPARDVPYPPPRAA